MVKRPAKQRSTAPSGVVAAAVPPVASPSRLALAMAVLALVAVAVYRPSLRNDFLQWDDGAYVRDNPHVRELSWDTVRWAATAKHASNWHPLTWLSHAVDAQIYGVERPWGPHLTSILWHAANSARVLLLLWRLTRRFWPAVFGAALFALHPLRVECVSWVAERKELLCTLFSLLAILAYLRYARAPSVGRYRWVVAAVAAARIAPSSRFTAERKIVDAGGKPRLLYRA